jgi:nucleoside-diphosphate-sugar epimerase
MGVTLLVGGSGFTGKLTSHYLIEKQESVIDFDLMPPEEYIEGVVFHRGNVLEIEQIIEAIRKYKVDKIIHFAFLLTRETELNPHLGTKINILGTSNVFEAARLEGIKRVTYCSSLAVYGSQDSARISVLKEDDVGYPECLYGTAKLYNEHLACEFNKLYDTLMVSVRFGIVIGPGRSGGIANWAGDFASNPALGKPVVLPLIPEQQLLLTYVKNAACSVAEISCAQDLSHTVYHCPSFTISAADLKKKVQQYIPDAVIDFDPQATILPFPTNWDSSRYQSQFPITFATLDECLEDHIRTIRMSKK